MHSLRLSLLSPISLSVFVPTLAILIGLAGRPAFAAEETLSAPAESAGTEAASPQAAVEPLSGDAQKAASEEPAYGFSLNLNHFFGFRQEVDPFTVFDLGGSWKAHGYRLSLSQRLTKSYFVYEDDSEVQAADTVLSLSRPFGQPIYGFKAGLSFSLTLPVSEFSRRQEVTTKPRLGLSLSRDFLDGRLNYSVGGAFQYNISEYRTTKTGVGAGGGSPLREYNWALDNTLAYKLVDKLTLTAYLSYIRIKYFDVGYKNRVSTATNDALLNTNYTIDFNASYQVLPQLAIGGGYSQSDIVEKTGGITEAYLFDVYTTQWYMGLSTSI